MSKREYEREYERDRLRENVYFPLKLYKLYEN